MNVCAPCIECYMAGGCSSVIRALAAQTRSPRFKTAGSLAAQTRSPGFKTADSLAAQTRSPGFNTADFSYPLITMYDTLKQVFHTRQSKLWTSTVVLRV